MANHHTHRAQNPPDRPPVSTFELKPAAVRAAITSHLKINQDLFVTHVERERVYGQEEPEEWPTPQTVITPLSRKPLLPFRRTSIAGGRTIGGDTSQEALRRARKKAARKPLTS